MKHRTARIGIRAAQIALIPLQILFLLLFVVGLLIAGAVLGIMHLVIAARDRRSEAPPVTGRALTRAAA